MYGCCKRVCYGVMLLCVVCTCLVYLFYGKSFIIYRKQNIHTQAIIPFEIGAYDGKLYLYIYTKYVVIDMVYQFGYIFLNVIPTRRVYYPVAPHIHFIDSFRAQTFDFGMDTIRL